MRKRETRYVSQVFSCLLIWVFFYIEMLRGGIATHDELQSIAQCIEGNQKIILGARWGMGLFHYLPTTLHSSMPNYALYRLLTIAGLMIACTSVMVVLYRHVDRMLCWMFPIAFILLAQVTLEHDGLFAFGWGYQFDIALVFISIECFLTFKKTGGKKYKILSATVYLLAIMSYEAFIAFGICLFVIDIMHMLAEGKIKFWELISDLIWHFWAALFYTLSFVILASFYPAGDATIGNETSIMGYLQTLTSFSIGLFPLRFRPYDYRQLLNFAVELSWENLAIWMMILVFITLALDCIRKSEKISPIKYFAYCIISLLGMILPNIVISMTSKFQGWVVKSGVKTFGTSYYSYFFLIFWLIVTAVFCYHQMKYKKIVIGVIACVFALVVRFTLSGNDAYLDTLHKNQNRYEAFMDIIGTEYFSQLPENAQIYTNDYVGIHNNIDSLSVLASSVSRNKVKVLNDKSQLDWNLPVYYLDYDPEIDGTYLFEMIADNISDKAYICLKDTLRYYHCLFRSAAQGTFPVCVDERRIGCYTRNVVTPTLYTEQNSVLVQGEEMDTETFTVNRNSSRMDSSIISLEGIYGLEQWGRWAQKEYAVVIDNVSNEENCRLDIRVAAGIGVGTALNLECNGIYGQYEIPAEGAELQIEIPLIQGVNQIKFQSEADDMDVLGEYRNLNMAVYKLDVIYEGETYSYAYQ